MGTVDWIVKHAKKNYSSQAKFTTTALAGLLIVIMVPCLFVYLSSLENGKLSISKHPAFLVIVGIIALCGISLAFWTIWAQFHKAQGTPIPIMPTKKLLINKPYSYCRNPMALGTILYYAGISIIVRSCLSGVVTVAFTSLLIILTKTIEEKEMTIRFGEDYIKYKNATPFLIPFTHCQKKDNIQ